jgi:tetratricopeptide (TPR) repeat protein
VLQMSDPFDAGKEITLSEALDETAKRIDAKFADRPDLSAEIRFGIGYSMLSRYRLEEAEQQLLRAFEDSKKVFGTHDIRTLRVMEGIAGLRHEQGDVTTAEAMYLDIRRMMEEIGQQDDPLYVDVLGNLGNFHLTLERYADADRLLREALAAEGLQREPDALDHANLLNNLAHAAHGLEDWVRAADLYMQAQREYERLFPEGNPDLAVVINNRALLEEDRNDPLAALDLHRQSLAVRQKVFGGEHPMIVTAMANVARLTTLHGDASEALEMAQRAVEMADRVYTAPANRHASAYITLANALFANQRHRDAIAAWKRARELLAKLDEVPPSVSSYLERVGASICKDSDTQADLCL